MLRTLSKNKKQLLAHMLVFSAVIALVLSFVFVLPVTDVFGQEGGNPHAFDEDGNVNQNTTATSKGVEGDGEIRWYHRLGSYIGYVVLTIAALFTHVGGTMLDMAVREVVLGMGAEIRDSGAGNSINNAWTIIRDFCNLAFIFGFVWIGIQTILKGFDGAGVKRTLSSLIIAALLINFSLFFSQVVVDVSNVLAVEIHEVLSVDKTGESDNKGIASHFMNQMGLLTLWDTESEQLASVDAVGSPSFFIMGAVFLMVAAFVFAAGAILLVIRFVVLIFVMIFSPILFAAMVFESTRQYSTKLWKILLSQAFFAPVYLLMLLISFRVVLGVTDHNAAGQDFVKALREGEQVETILNFTIITMFLILSLIAAKSISAVGATRAVAIGDNLRRGAQGYAGRGFARGTRLQKLAEKQKEWRESESRGARVGAAMLRGTGINAAASSVANAKWGSSRSAEDVVKEKRDIERGIARNKQVSGISTAISDTFKDGAGDNEKIAMEKAIAGASTDQLVKLLKKKKPGSKEYTALVSNMSQKQAEGVMNAKPEDFDDGKKEAFAKARAAAVGDRLVQKENERRANATPPQPAIKGIDQMEDLHKANAQDLAALDFNTIYKNAGKLTSKQVDDLKELSPTQAASLKEKRKKDLVTEFRSAGGAAAIFKRLNDSEKAKLPDEILTDRHAAEHFNTNILAKIPENDGIDGEKRKRIKQNVLDYYPDGSREREKYEKFFDNSPAGQRFG